MSSVIIRIKGKPIPTNYYEGAISMNFAVHANDVKPIMKEGHHVQFLLNHKNGCVAGCNAAIGYYTSEDFVITGAHEDQEVFFVLEGTGQAKVGDDIIDISPGSCFLVKPGLIHGIKRDPGCEYVKAVFFHAAI